MRNKELKAAAISGTLWSGIDALARQGLQLLVSIVLARLLSPEEFGTIGLLALFIGVARVFIDAGFASALIQRQEVNEVDLSSVFFFNICVSLLFAICLCLCASWIAGFYRMPILMPLTWMLAANLVVGSFGSVQGMLLTKSLNFRRHCTISLAAQTFSGSLAVILAWKGFGVWSLAVQSIMATLATTLLLWQSSTWRPKWLFSLSAIRSLFRFGSFLLLSALLETLFSRLNSLVIGRLYSATTLGYYSRADSTCLIPANLISGVLSRVAFPIFANAKDDPSLLRSGLRKAITLSMLVNVPTMLGLTAVAQALVLVLFGEKWLPCVPYLQILSLGALLWPLHVLNLNVLTALGHSRLFFRLEVIKKVFGISVVGVTALLGVEAIAWGMVLVGVVCFYINSFYSGRLVGYGAIPQSLDLLPCLVIGTIMAACSWSVSLLPIASPVLTLSAQIVVGVVVFIGLCALLRVSAFLEAWSIAKPLLVACRSRIQAGGP